MGRPLASSTDLSSVHFVNLVRSSLVVALGLAGGYTGSASLSRAHRGLTPGTNQTSPSSPSTVRVTYAMTSFLRPGTLALELHTTFNTQAKRSNLFNFWSKFTHALCPRSIFSLLCFGSILGFCCLSPTCYLPIYFSHNPPLEHCCRISYYFRCVP